MRVQLLCGEMWGFQEVTVILRWFIIYWLSFTGNITGDSQTIELTAVILRIDLNNETLFHWAFLSSALEVDTYVIWHSGKPKGEHSVLAGPVNEYSCWDFLQTQKDQTHRAPVTFLHILIWQVFNQLKPVMNGKHTCNSYSLYINDNTLIVCKLHTESTFNIIPPCCVVTFNHREQTLTKCAPTTAS